MAGPYSQRIAVEETLSSTGSGSIKRKGGPRVHLAYKDPFDAQRNVELPFVMAVMSDLSGNAGAEKPDLAEREFRPVSTDNLDEFMDSIRPGVAMSVPNRLDPEAGDKIGVSLTFRKMADLEPAAIARQVPALRALIEAREELKTLKRLMNGRAAAQKRINALLADPALMAALGDRAGGADDETA